MLARIEDEKEEIPIRLHAINQCSAIHLVGDSNSTRSAESRSAVSTPNGQLHYMAFWIASLGKAISSPATLVRSRALDILSDNFNDPSTDPAFRNAWRKIVPNLAEVTKSEDPRVSNAALVLLGRPARLRRPCRP